MSCLPRLLIHLGCVLAICGATVHSIITAGQASAADLEITIAAGKYDRNNAPVSIAVRLPGAVADVSSIRLIASDGKTVVAQVSAPSLLPGNRPDKAAGKFLARDITFVVSGLKAGQTEKYTANLPNSAPRSSSGKDAGEKDAGEKNAGEKNAAAGIFAWHDTPNKFTELRRGDRPVLRYMYEPLDESTEQRRGETYKVYHHVFDPQGKRLMTKGPGGLFPHHRGLFYGFNRISYGEGQKADIWHCNHGEYQSHDAVVSIEQGAVLGRHRLAIDWHGRDGKVFAKEQRELTAYQTNGGTLIEFASRLSSEVGTLRLDGDPQHAGFQFRASQEVPDKTKQQTYYLRPDGKGNPGEFRNWPGNKDHVNLPWNAMSIVLGEQRYTIVYLDKPSNPKPARYSERNYGRFGSYFVAQVETDKPLELNYRIWIQAGEVSVAEAAAQSHNFVEPITATVKVN